MSWTILATPEFSRWLATLEEGNQDAILVDLKVLENFGPSLGRPHVDTLKQSAHANMKELRTAHAGHQYRCLFAFDPLRRAVVLLGGDKVGQNERKFYERLIREADALMDRHLALHVKPAPSQPKAPSSTRKGKKP